MTTQNDNLIESREEARLRALFAGAYPAGEPSENLRLRIAAISAQAQEKADARRHGRRRMRLALAAFGASVLAAVLFLAWPAITTARMLWEIDGAIRDAKSVHSVIWRLVPGKPRQVDSETWYQGGKWRLERADPPTTQIYAGGKLWSYEPDSQMVLLRRAASPFAYAPSGFSMNATIHDAAQFGWKYHIRVLGTTVQNGRTLRRLLVQNADSEREVYLVDPATDLPAETIIQEREGLRWATWGVATATYNERLPASLFIPSFPKSARVIDLDQGRAGWTRQFSRVLARRQVGNRAIVLRDVEANANGDIFLLYTSGMSPTDPYNQWNITLADNQGTTYYRGPWFAPYMYYALPRRHDFSNGFLIDGDQLEGACFIPVNRHPAGPRRVTISLTVPVNLIHRDAAAAAAGKLLPFQNGPDSQVTFKVAIPGPTCDVLPGYMPFMAQPIFAGDLGKQEKITALDADLDSDRSQAFQLSTTPQGLPQALSLYYKAIDINRQILAVTGDKDNTGTYLWFGVYQAARGLGHTDEAREALIHSRDASLQQHQDFHMSGPMDQDPHWRDIEQACREMGVPQ